MADPTYHLAQVNIAALREPLDSPVLADFVAALTPINALADGNPGFVWRLQTEDGDATAIRPFDDDMIIVNMSVWESVEALADYVYRSAHTDVMRRRREWFHRMAEAYTALWWVPAGRLPAVRSARTRLAYLRRHGPTAHAFTFRQPFPPPSSARPIEVRDDDLCPV
jgi:hypothetical protein